MSGYWGVVWEARIVARRVTFVIGGWFCWMKVIFSNASGCGVRVH